MRIGTRTAAGAAVLCAAAVAGCSDNGNAGSPASTSPAPVASVASVTASSSAESARTVSVHAGSLGKILVNGKGHALYLYEADRTKKSTCSGECARTWPPLIVTRAPKAGGGGVKQALLGSVSRSDGSRQVTYNGHPLYTFKGDKKAGVANGQGDLSFGAKWYVLDTAGKKNTTPQQNSGGY
ncbi:hypothetical protein ABZ707_27320 [Streptomyces sp. NPDC006923]|uniref:COG4315 family predicted lipoprotein n=1 Tax=Streptomyces sp. NPDC006923 TaxID=3155355 RepID=UPI003400EDED